jgi:ribonuclease P protein component
LPSPRGKARVGFIVANTIDNRATARNLIKRRLRAIVRLKLTAMKNFDCLIIAKPAIKGKTYQELEKEVLYLLRRTGVLK